MRKYTNHIDQILLAIDNTLESTATEILGNYEMVLMRVFGVEIEDTALLKPSDAHSYTTDDDIWINWGTAESMDRFNTLGSCDCSCHAPGGEPAFIVADEPDAEEYGEEDSFCCDCWVNCAHCGSATNVRHINHEMCMACLGEVSGLSDPPDDDHRGNCTVCNANLFWTGDMREDAHSTCLQCRSL